MGLGLFPGLLAFLAAACSQPAGPASADGAHRMDSGLVCAEPLASFGRVWEGSVLEHEFRFEHRGSEPLAVESVRADCGCTAARLAVLDGGEWRAYREGDSLAAGSVLSVGIRYDTRGKTGDAPRTVTLLPAAPYGPVSVRVAADVRPWLVAERDHVGLIELSEGETATRSFTVRSAEERAFALSHTGLGVPPFIDLVLAPEAPDASGRAARWTVTLTIRPDAPRGTRSYPLYLVSDVPVPGAPADVDGEPVRHALTPMIAVRVVGALSVDPPHLAFGAVRPSETVSKSLRLSSHDAGFVFAEPRARLEPVPVPGRGDDFPLAETASLRIRAVDGAPAWDVELLLDGLADGVDGTFLARLVLETGHPDLPELYANVTGVCIRTGPPGAAGSRAR